MNEFEVEPRFKFQLEPSDLRIYTFRPGPSGFIHCPATAVRITHIPTGLHAECSTNRSEHANKAEALRMLSEIVELFYKQNSTRTDVTEVLNENNIREIMRRSGYTGSCCNDYWPVSFARAVEKKVIDKLKAQGKLL